MSQADTPQPRICPQCDVGVQYLNLNLVPASTRHYRYLVMGLVKIRGTVMRTWVCSLCTHVDDAGTKWPPPEPEIRPQTVSAIKRLRTAGYRFFEWEKTNAKL